MKTVLALGQIMNEFACWN